MAELACPQCGAACDPGHRFCPGCGFPIGELVGTSEDPLVGTTLPGGYVILELVGIGGMGRVYRAEQTALGRTVAVKVIHPHLSGDENSAIRFITEARAASRLNHPNSVGVIDFGKNGKQLYLVMEFLRGRDLARVAHEDGPLPLRRIVDVLVQVMAALAEAHHLGIIHRDLKPENIVLEPMRRGGDFVKVVDFGLAKMRAEVADTGITSPGIVCGTPDYMSPEQGRGDPIDARSDLYACGVLLFQLLTSRLPFESESPTQVVLMHISAAVPDPCRVAPERRIPEELSAIVRKALAKEPEDRFQSADELAAALRAVFADAEPTSIRFAAPEVGVSCPACGAAVPRGQKFCGECGARVSALPTAPLSPRPSLMPSRLPLPFVARDEEIEWLIGCRFEVDTALGAARVVGEPGSGKSRLLEELLRLVEPQGDFVVRTGPDPFWAEVSYHALRAAIVGLAGLPAGGGPGDWPGASPEARRGLREVFGLAEPETRWGSSGPRPRTSVVGLPRGPGEISPEERRFMAAEALRWALSRAPRRGQSARILLVVDDLHAVDGASRNAFADLVAEPPLLPVLVVAAHAQGFDPGWASGALRQLGPVPTDVAAALVKGILPPASSGAGAGVLPLYVEHLVRHNADGGGEPPPRLADFLAQRVERLDAAARRTLQALAVLGDATSEQDLAALLPDLADVPGQLARLEAAGFVGPGRAARAGPPLRATAHPLLREVVLASTPASVRRALHERALASGSSLPLEAQAAHAFFAQNAFEALMFLEQVADRAATRGDGAGSVGALRRGLELARLELFRGELDDPMGAVLIFSRKLGEALARAGDLLDADGVLREALDLAGPSGQDRARLLGALAFVARERERQAEASAYLREAVELARKEGSGELLLTLEQLRRSWATG